MSKQIVIKRPSLDQARRRTSKVNSYQNVDLVIDDHLNSLNGSFYYIKTQGCQANIRDEETMSGMLSSIGMKRTNNKNKARVIIFNTCAVRENAEQKLYAYLGEVKDLKLHNKDKIIIISGCMIQQEESFHVLETKYHTIDIFMGTNAIHNLLNLISMHIETNKQIVDIPSDDETIYEGLPTCRNETFRAFVNITYGCDKFCTYCIVPYTRGKERSRKIDDILSECKNLVEEGYKEITLLGQNVNAYGRDLKDGTTFAYLLEEVAKLGIPRLRFLTSHPWNFTDELIDVIGKYDNIMPYLHLPLQSGNDNVLRRMGRRYTKEEYLDLVNKIRAKKPSIAFGTDIIVGFPNETEEEFLDTLEMVHKVHYASAFTFIYSPRIGTPAAKIVDKTTKEEKADRFELLKEAVEEETAAFAETLVGTTQLVLVEKVSKKDSSKLSGYTEQYKLVHFTGTPDLIGKIVKVKILYSKVYALHGELVNE